MTTPLAIIGSGPAGLTAAIYAARADLMPLVFAGRTPGGQLTTTTVIENYPGFQEGIAGPELMRNMMAQAERFGARIIYEEAAALEQQDGHFVIKDGAGQQYEATAVIAATGATPRWLNVPGEKELTAKGVHTCATCDGAFYRGKKVAVIGGGDAAMEEANFLTKFADQVTIIHRRDVWRASPIMLERARSNPKIDWLTNKEVVEFAGQAHLTAVKLRDTITAEESERAFDGAFLAIGHTPNLQLVKHLLPTTDDEQLAEPHPPLTEVDGLFVAGDLADTAYRQAITAAGAGCAAALTAERWLAGREAAKIERK